MEVTKMINEICPNCYGENLYVDRVDVFGGNVKRMYQIDVQICLECGFVEMYVPKKDLGKFSK